MSETACRKADTIDAAGSIVLELSHLFGYDRRSPGPFMGQISLPTAYLALYQVTLSDETRDALRP
jgi:hypothetical protein